MSQREIPARWKANRTADRLTDVNASEFTPHEKRVSLTAAVEEGVFFDGRTAQQRGRTLKQLAESMIGAIDGVFRKRARQEQGDDWPTAGGEYADSLRVSDVVETVVSVIENSVADVDEDLGGEVWGDVALDSPLGRIEHADREVHWQVIRGVLECFVARRREQRAEMYASEREDAVSDLLQAAMRLRYFEGEKEAALEAVETAYDREHPSFPDR